MAGLGGQPWQGRSEGTVRDSKRQLCALLGADHCPGWAAHKKAARDFFFKTIFLKHYQKEKKETLSSVKEGEQGIAISPKPTDHG